MPARTPSASRAAAKPRRQRAAARSSWNVRVLRQAALFVGLVFVAYLPSLSGGFILDDDFLLTDNPLIKSPSGLYWFWGTTKAADYWPMTNTTFWLEWRLWGMHPTGYHVTNVLMHIGAALLIWAILHKLAIPGAYLAAILFAVHPVNVESVAWIAQRKNTLAMIFFLLSILWYLPLLNGPSSDRVPQRQTGYWLSLATFALALLSKGSVAILPVVLLGLIVMRRRLERRDWLRLARFFVLAAALTLVNIAVQHVGGVVLRTASFAERLSGAGAAVWFYLSKALLPLYLAFVYPMWHIQAGQWLWWLPLTACLGVTAALWRQRNSAAKNWARPTLFAWGYFCVALVPVMGFTDVGFMQYSLVADHYQHIAIIGVAAAAGVAWSVWHAAARKSVRSLATTAAVSIVALLTLLTWQQCRLYADPITLYEASLKDSPGSWLIENNLANALSNSGRSQEALKHYELALQANPDYALARYNLGRELVKQGRIEEGIEQYRRAIQIQPDYPAAYYNMGNAFRKERKLDDAIEQYKLALHYNPDFADASFNMANVLSDSGKLPEAIEQYQQAIILDPSDPEIHFNFANALRKSDQLQRAIEQYRETLRLNPNYVEAYNNLGTALLHACQPGEAVEQFQQAVRLKPDHVAAYFNMATSYARLNRPADAMAAAQRALELARTQGNAGVVQRISAWINAYSSDSSRFNGTSSGSVPSP